MHPVSGSRTAELSDGSLEPNDDPTELLFRGALADVDELLDADERQGIGREIPRPDCAESADARG